MQFRVLGPLEVDAGDGPIPLGGPKQRAVLANLLIRANQVVPAETLIDEVWGGEPPEKARNTLQTYVSNLRRELGDDRLQGRPPGYVLLLDPFELDAARFDSLVRDAKQALSIDPNVAIATLDDALSLWRGPALADLADRPSLLAEAARLDELRLEAQEDRVEGLLASGEQSRAIGELEGLLAHHELREGLWSLLMLALYREGRQGDALNTFQRAREILADELGIDPSPELVRLHERILRQDAGLDLKGEPLRGYRLLERIGDGPDGAVFRAIQPHVERDVATKVFNERIASDPAFVQRFESAAQSAAALEHPHIVPIYDYWREPGRAYVVSRYLRGGSLQARRNRGDDLDDGRALRVVEQIASALAFAHRQGVIHGHLCASNVLFDAEDNAYLGDFSLRATPTTDRTQDIRGLARLARDLLGDGMPTRLVELAEAAEGGAETPGSAAFADAARTTLEPGATRDPRRAEARNPYKGLRSFTEADAGDFFGRGALIDRSVSRLNETGSGTRFLAIVGPSGGGKSSAMRAGLVPAIRRGALEGSSEPYLAEMFPGAHPLEELEAALLRIAVRPASRLRDLLERGSRGLLEAVDLTIPGDGELVLLVDQLEEIFTITTSAQERESFLESLRVACVDPESRVRVIVTMRADFYDRPLIYPRFGELLAARTEAITPLTPDELEQAIRRPAERVGVRLEPGLVAEMIADVAHQPGALPLVQYALMELFERRDDDVVGLGSYREIGGVAGALSARAERLYAAADPGWRTTVRQVFLRLVTLGEGRQDTRRRVARRELDALEVDPAATSDVLDTFGRHRLLTFDREPTTREPTVEIAHESLLGAWGRLHGWIDDAREDLRLERRLGRAAAEWRGSARDPSFLLRGARLEHVETWAEATDLAIGSGERAYVKASIDRRDLERSEETERRAHEGRVERRSRGRLRALVAVFAVAALVAASLTIVATNQSERAGRAAGIAQARELAAAAVAGLDEDPERSVLLAMEAVRRTRTDDGSAMPEAVDALHRSVSESRILLTVPGVGGSADWSPSGVIANEDDVGSGNVEIRSDETGERLFTFEAHQGDITGMAFSVDGSMLATTGVDGWLKVWDPADGSKVSEIHGRGAAALPSFSADGSLAAATWSGDLECPSTAGQVRVILPATGHVVRENTGLCDPGRVAFSPDATRMATLSARQDGTQYVGRIMPVRGDAHGGAVVPFEVPVWDGTDSVEWSTDGRFLTGPDRPYVWDARSGERLYLVKGHIGDVAAIDWDPRRSRLVTAGVDATVHLWEIDRGGYRDVLRIPVAGGEIEDVAFSPDGTRLMTTSDHQLRVYRAGPAAELASLPGSGDVAFLPHDRLLSLGTTSLKMWDIDDGRGTAIGPPLRPPAADHFYGPTFEVSPDGRWVAVEEQRPGDTLVVTIWEMTTGRVASTQAGIGFLAWAPDSRSLAVDRSGSLELVDLDGRVIRTFSNSGVRYNDAAFSTDGSTLVTSAERGPGECEDPVVQVRDVASGAILTSIATCAYFVIVGPGGRWIVTATDTPRMWDAQSGRSVGSFPTPPGGYVQDMVLSPDGSRLAVVGASETVRLFEASTMEEQLVLRGHACGVENIAFSADGSMLASQASCDGVRVWALDIDDLLGVAQRNITRSLTVEECSRYLHLDACPSDPSTT